MSIVPIVVISSTAFGNAYGEYNGTDINWYSSSYKGDGYYGYTDGLHTYSYQLTGFVGILGFQASLATTPTVSDWFDITTSQVGDGINPVTATGFKNFSGNFVWVRASITRFTAGTINKVLYN
jgi:hypothetical protein